MGTGQMMLTIAALMLLSVILLRINNVFLNTNTTLYETKFNVTAVSLGTSIIEEASSKAFDQNTEVNPVIDLSSLSSTLGKETGEVYPNFNDVDDFNNYTRSTANDTTFKSAIFNCVCKVNYVNTATPEVATSSRTWNKRIRVTVSSPSMKDTIKLSSIISYWYFR